MWKDEQFILYCIWCFIEAKMVCIIQCTYLKVRERYSLFYALIFHFFHINHFYQETVAYFKYTNI